MTTPNHLLAWLQLLDHHPEDHLPLVETESRFAARLLIRRRVGGPPAAQSSLRGEGREDFLRCRIDRYLTLELSHECL